MWLVLEMSAKMAASRKSAYLIHLDKSILSASMRESVQVKEVFVPRDSGHVNSVVISDMFPRVNFQVSTTS
jgi:hypothetical protein